MSQPEVPPPEHRKRACEVLGCQQVHLIFCEKDPHTFFCVGVAEKPPRDDDRLIICCGTRDDNGNPDALTWALNRADAYTLLMLLGEGLLALEGVEIEEVDEDA